ncbi:helix-turn-helix domain-containing protein [Terrimonas sp. NA20]|uniref:Helix-turn-helix domain-containing protein n=1 Tax=Terrimonas ginsenosidimutans TaxID=2908004 RepID=A0ABS9KP72_9BACT|nr:helix-turn-helix domain-containing protein [Terrimonas ginsenosidimutans]MCG2614123.1 helix-turn-helix domain-containing protein [Terrimonas ginsenosidimutans]
MPRKQSIPQHRMTSHSPHGIFMRNLKNEDFPPPENVSRPHRDDHFLFIFQECGENQLVVDSQTVNARGRKVLCILPGQVHHVTKFDPIDAWFVAVATTLVPEHVRTLLQQTAQPLQAADVNDRWAVKLNTAVSLLQLHLEDPSFTQDSFPMIKAATESVLSIFAAIYREQPVQAAAKEGRAAEITRKFKTLLQQQYRVVKSPAAYAAMLNVSPAYLNEVVSNTTGMPVSKWIHQEILLEAKRLLFYTEFTVREIAYELGYEDHTYFTRLFSKQEGISPSKYRLAR